MAFIDELQLHIKAGHGGKGIVAWQHEKSRDHAGPGGGDGGAGGSVYIKALRNIGLLYKYRSIKEFSAKRGEAGQNWTKKGADGESITIELPIGSIVTNLNTGKVIELLKDGEEVLLLKGGKGGFGNDHFKGSTNQRPEESTEGLPGEEADFHIELRLVVDAGFVGLPNAGKSSLLNALTNARAKIGNYQFTTIEPNLGDFYGYILADIPGLIEGASDGKGLGYKFLRHIQRTKMIFHCISAENEDVVSVYKTIRNELEKYDKSLAEKREIIILTKTDLVSPSVVEKQEKELQKLTKEKILKVSVIDDASLSSLKKELNNLFKSIG